MSHDYHEDLEGFHPDQILHDGCTECEQRGEDVERAISSLDGFNFVRAWRRAADWQAFTPPSGRNAEHISSAEAPLLRVLWAVQNRGATL